MATTAFTDIKALEEEIRKQDLEIESILKELGVQLGSDSQPSWIWKCPKCNELNVDGETPLSACELCNEPKPVAAKSAPKAPPPPTGSLNLLQATTFHPGWKCHACGTHNDESLYECKMCYNDKEDNETLARPTAQVIGWRCHSCGTPNDASVYECKTCRGDNKDKPAAVTVVSNAAAIGWKCHACGTPNDASSYECSLCYGDKSDFEKPVEVKVETKKTCPYCMSAVLDPSAKECAVCYGDFESVTQETELPENAWMCSACLTINAMDAIECKLCFADRPSAQWKCHACYTLNDDEVLECVICYAERNEGNEEASETVEEEAPLRGWKCVACMSINPNMVEECTVCYADREFVPPAGAFPVLDLSGGAREMLDERRARQLLSTATDPLAVRKLIFKTKSFGAGASAVAVEYLRRMTNVEDADFSDIIAGRPTEEALGVLQRMSEALPLSTTLRSLDLSDNAIGERGMRVLTNAMRLVSKNIEKLSFRNNGLSEMAVKLLVEALGDTPRLQALHLFSNMCGNGGAIALSNLFSRLPTNPALPFEFTMSSCRVLPEGGLSLVKSLKTVAPRLRYLDLSDMVMGKDAGLELAAVLSQSKALKVLLLRDCGVQGTKSIKAVVEAIINLPALEQLDVCEIPLGAGSVKSLLQGLKQHGNGLKTLLLGLNEAKAESFAAIVEPDTFLGLESIDLRESKLDDAFAQKFINKYKSSTALRTIELGGNPFSQATIETLKSTFGDRLGDMYPPPEDDEDEDN